MRRNPVAGLVAVALCGVGCAAFDTRSMPPPASLTGGDELVDQARRLTAEKGLIEARDFLEEALAERDDSRGAMESRFQAAAADPNRSYPDSVAALPPDRRARIGLAFIPGMRAKAGQDISKPVAALSHASKETQKMGFHASLIPAVGRGDVDENAAAMADTIRRIFEENDDVILIAKSKGAHDLIHYLRHQGSQLPVAQREKLKVVCILAGTVQGSYVADWFARSADPWAIGMRLSLLVSGKGGQIRMLKTVADSPWKDAPSSFPRDTYPNLTWINLVVLPEGSDGRASGREWSPFYSRHIQKTLGWESPSDSLVETAAEVLPSHLDVPEWIIRIVGNHAFPSGRFLNGARVTPRTEPLPTGMNPASGAEIMNAFLRALPTSVLR